VHVLIGLRYVAASGILAFCLWLLCRWDRSELALNAGLSRRAAAREYPRTHRVMSDASYWIIPAYGVIAIWAIWSLFH
jgi:hypothetical protein